MPKVLICYYSRSGNTKAMAYMIADGIRSADVDVDVKKVADVKPADLLRYDGLVFGSPTYYGVCAAELKSLIDKSVKYHGKLCCKVGGAFASSANVGGGNETTVLQLLQAHLIHGMVIIGDSEGDHYGPVSIEKPNKRVEKDCKEYGKKIAWLVKKLSE
ncbi:MAG TPA: flavodoxin family protein [Euryarchaeota archaeon]|nr:flavodoxin family protein [Euryarchaeota archaeon]